MDALHISGSQQVNAPEWKYIAADCSSRQAIPAGVTAEVVHAVLLLAADVDKIKGFRFDRQLLARLDTTCYRAHQA